MIALPESMGSYSAPSNWLDLCRPGRVVVMTGKVELGQGILGAVSQIVADALGVDPSCVDVASGDTRCVPDEWYTAGSYSVENAWTVLRAVCLHVRCCLVDLAAEKLMVDPSVVDIQSGIFLLDGAVSSLDLWSVAGSMAWDAPLTELRQPAEVPRQRWVGCAVPRPDLPGKIGGAGFIHDLHFPEMLHARMVRSPAPGCRFLSWSQAVAQQQYPGVQLVQIGEVIAIVAAREEVAVAASAAQHIFRWSSADVPAPDSGELLVPGALLQMRTVPRGVVDEPAHAGAGLSLEATYERPFLAHASIAPCCALALFRQGVLTVWTHSQGVFALRKQIQRAMARHVALSRVDVIHAPGAGCYGHNGADDAAFEACLIAARKPGKVVRLLWTRPGEFQDAPAGSAMVIKVAASLRDGQIDGWVADLWSGSHGRRPGWEGRVNLEAARLACPDIQESVAQEDVSAAAGGGGDRNALPIYALGRRSIIYHYLPDMPVRTSSLRTLGAHTNLFAIESFMDEMAVLGGCDPLDFRRSHLDDARALAVLDRVAAMSRWQRNQPMETGRAKGLGIARYKNKAAWLAAVVEVELEEDIQVTRVWCAVDCGVAVDPDGVRNQIEGGVIQALSWCLCENLPVTRGGAILAQTWEDYPILTFAQVPRIEIELLAPPDSVPLGVGEAAAGPVAGALANAVAVAAGARVRTLPINRESLARALA
jgi:nicotinate dehydrogenase subunit B